MSAGEACSSGTQALPCADPLYYCGGGVVLAEDVYQAASSGECNVPGANNTLLCEAIAANPNITVLVSAGSCKPTCASGGGAPATQDVPKDCYSYDIAIKTPTVEVAQSALSALTSAAITSSVTSALGGFSSSALQFSIVSAEINTIVGFGFFPPPPSPPPPPPPLTPLSPASGSPAGNSTSSSTVPTAVLSYGPWSACSTECGAGLSTRPASCYGPDGTLLAPQQCPGGAQAQTSQPCSNPCTGPYWTYTSWSTCSSTCGGGVATRQASCVSANGTACAGEQQPTTTACNTAPCNAHSWSISPWSACSAGCVGGTQTRTVRCLDSSGQAANATACVGATPATSEACNAQPCDFCQANPCLGRGTCQGGACTCNSGYYGKYCEAAPSCKSGVVDANLACCASGLVDAQGACCSQGSGLDGSGQCCAQKVDACGQCGGSALFVDMQGACCAVVDANGVCCASGNVDECGVCDGVGNSCGVQLTGTVGVPSSLVMGNSVQADPINAFFGGAAAALGLPAGSLVVGNISLAPAGGGAGRRRLAQSIGALVPLEVTATVNATSNLTAGAQPSAAWIAAQLPAAAANQSAAWGVQLEGPVGASRTAVCGNHICELGERSTVGVQNGTCPQDCGLPATSCPGGCGTGGVCLPASGVCRCFFGYSGATCAECAAGFVLSGGTHCVTNVVGLQLVNSSVVNGKGTALVSGSVDSGSGGTSAGVIAGAVIGGLAALALLIVAACCCCRRRSGSAYPSTGAAYDGNKLPGAAFMNAAFASEAQRDEELGLRQKYGSGATHGTANDGRLYAVHVAAGADVDGSRDFPLRAHSAHLHGSAPMGDALRHSTHSLPVFGELERRASSQEAHGPERAQLEFIVAASGVQGNALRAQQYQQQCLCQQQQQHCEEDPPALRSSRSGSTMPPLPPRYGNLRDSLQSGAASAALSLPEPQQAASPEAAGRQSVEGGVVGTAAAASIAATHANGLGFPAHPRPARPPSSQSTSAIDPCARLFFNPAFSVDAGPEELTALVAHVPRKPLSARNRPSEPLAEPQHTRRPLSARAAVAATARTAAPVAPPLRHASSTGATRRAAAGGSGDTLEERRAKLEALRAAVRGLEAAQQQEGGPPLPAHDPAHLVPPPAAKPAGFLPGRPAVPRLPISAMNKKRTLLQRPTWAGRTASPPQAQQQVASQGLIAAHPGERPRPSSAAKPCDGARIESKVTLESLSARAAKSAGPGAPADPRYSQVLAVVDGALRSATGSAGNSPTRIPLPAGVRRERHG